MTAACEALQQYDVLYNKYSRTDLARRVSQALSVPVAIGNSKMYIERKLEGKRVVIQIIFT